jgi:hypothetical protein
MLDPSLVCSLLQLAMFNRTSFRPKAFGLKLALVWGINSPYVLRGSGDPRDMSIGSTDPIIPFIATR